ncbi:MAG: YeeE/YedE family protein [Gammaproteobacteria bacterium]|nr:YeeE/YedE family protein [Gammaproteobacteria bacterium]
MITNDYMMAALGGALIGISAVLLLWLNGRIAGISGIINGAFSRTAGEAGWRIAFIVGLLAGGLLFQLFADQPLITRSNYPLPLTIGAGLLVGFGTRMGSGCTSGHGICGISRLSPRSIVATMLFVGVGMLVATTLQGFLK